MEPNENVRGVFLTDSKRTTQRLPTGSATGSVLERKNGVHTGGQRFYAMDCPEAGEKWIIQKYTSITPKTNFKFYNYFADKDENPQVQGSEWDYNFSEQNGVTKVSISIFNESFERMENHD